MTAFRRPETAFSRYRPLVLALALAAMLGACTVGPPYGRSGGPAVPGAPSEDELSPQTGEINVNPGGLSGLAARDVLAKLGDKRFRRREAPAEIWQYFGPGCVLDLFLYDEKGAQRVTHAELRSRTLAPAAQADCLSQLLAGKRGDVSS